MQLYFVRHAESVSNAKLKDVLGKGDQLTQLGQAQALTLSKELSKHQYDRIYVSPSLRTIQTVAPYLRISGSRATILPICAEIPGPSLTKIVETLFGSRSKKRKAKSIETLPEHADLVVPHADYQDPPVRHETLKDGIKRTELLARYLMDTYGQSGLSVLLVSHGEMGKRLISRMAGTLVPHPDNAKLWKLSGTGCPLHLELVNGQNFMHPPRRISFRMAVCGSQAPKSVYVGLRGQDHLHRRSPDGLIRQHHCS